MEIEKQADLEDNYSNPKPFKFTLIEDLLTPVSKFEGERKVRILGVVKAYLNDADVKSIRTIVDSESQKKKSCIAFKEDPQHDAYKKQNLIENGHTLTHVLFGFENTNIFAEITKDLNQKEDLKSLGLIYLCGTLKMDCRGIPYLRAEVCSKAQGIDLNVYTKTVKLMQHLARVMFKPKSLKLEVN